MGCYADYSNKRDISLIYSTYAGMTIEYCIGVCFNTGYQVAGLQLGLKFICI